VNQIGSPQTVDKVKSLNIIQKPLLYNLFAYFIMYTF